MTRQFMPVIYEIVPERSIADYVGEVDGIERISIVSVPIAYNSTPISHNKDDGKIYMHEINNWCKDAGIEEYGYMLYRTPIAGYTEALMAVFFNKDEDLTMFKMRWE